MTTIEQDLQALIARAAAEGHVATISLLSAWPPAMGAYSMVGEVRPARGGARASLAKPQPVGGALTKQQQCDLATASFCVASVGDPTCHLHADNAERIIELLDSLRLATLSAPVAQPLRQAAADLLDTEMGELACTGSHAPAEDALGRLRDALAAAQPGEAVAHLNVTMEWPEREQGRHAGDEPYKVVDARAVYALAMELPVGRHPLYLAAPAQATAATDSQKALILKVAAALNRAGETPADALRMAEESVGAQAAAVPEAVGSDLIRAAMEKADFTYKPTAFAQALIDEICARIKAADDKAAEGDYMLDSDDCISVIRGTWGLAAPEAGAGGGKP